jgi:hypothetical protein
MFMDNASQRSLGWLRMTSMALALIALGVSAAQAGVEFVTSTTDCSNKVDLIGDGKDLFIIAGPNIQFEVFGNSVDLSNATTGFRISSTTDSAARIVQQRSGPTNLSRGCGNTGSAVVEIDSPIDLGADIQRTLFFKMPAGDESPLQIRIRAFPAINATWTSAQSAISCIVKTGTFEKLDQDKRLRIQLPPGHQQDATTCSSNQLSAQSASTIGELDIAAPFRHTATGVPAFMQFSQPTARPPGVNAGLNFNISVPAIRALTAPSTSTIVVRSANTNKTSNLTLEVIPGITNGFTQAANCRNLQTGDTVTVNDLIQCELRLSTPPGGTGSSFTLPGQRTSPSTGQLITFEVQDRLCVAAGSLNVNYSPASGIGTTTLSGTGTIFEVPLRAQSGAMSTGQPCASQAPGTQHTVKFWVGQRDIESGADFTQDSFRIRTAN